MKRAKRNPNKQTIKADKIDFIAHISKRTLFDYRLSDSESINLIRILSLSDNFYISLNATSKYLNISKDKLKRIFKNLKALGYLEIIKKDNEYIYNFKQESSQLVGTFKPCYIDQYTTAQLYALLNNRETPTKYKNLIKKYFESLTQSDIEIYNTTLNEIKNYEPEKDILKKSEEEQREIDILEYIKGK